MSLCSLYIIQYLSSYSSSHDRQLRSLPDVAPQGFGTTVILKNDHHTFALVHWSGLPKKVNNNFMQGGEGEKNILNNFSLSDQLTVN